MSDEDQLINRSYAMEDNSQSFFHRHVRPCMAEFVGTLLFVFLGSMAAITNSTLVLAVALGHGLGLAVLVAMMANISGGHFNPAVSLAVFLSGEIPLIKLVSYFVSQIIGGICGAGVTRLILPHDLFSMGNAGGQTLNDTITIGEGIVCEMALTTVLVLVILLTAVDKESQHPWAPLAIGFSLAADIIAGGAITGASMNPARSFGPAVVGSNVDKVHLWQYHYVYWVGPVCGALIAVIFYRLIFSDRHRNVVARLLR